MGFLKKRCAPVALVEPDDRLALQTHVGRRVAATPILTLDDHFETSEQDADHAILIKRLDIRSVPPWTVKPVVSS